MLHDQVLKWLTETGFPLEMSAAAAFRAAGFEVRQSTTYADAQTEKSREIDVLAEDPDFYGFVDLSVVVECKSSTKPWIVLIANDTLQSHNILRTFGVMSDPARLVLSRTSVEALEVAPFLRQQGRAGYSLRQAFAKDVDPAYGAAMNLLAACRGVIPEKAWGNWPVLAVVVPVLVVDSPILECELLDDGTLKLTEVEATEFLFSAHLPKQTICAVRITRIEKVGQLALDLRAAFKALRADFKIEEDRILTELKSASKLPE